MHFKFWAVTFLLFLQNSKFPKKKLVFSLWVLEMGFFSYKTCMEYKDYLSMKQGRLFCFVLSCWEPWCFILCSWYLWKALNEWGCTLPWFETVRSYDVEAHGCWIIFSMKIKSNQNWTNYWNLGAFLTLLKSPWRVRFTRFHFTIFRAKVVKDINFQVDFVAGNSNKLQKLGSEGKISWALYVFTLGPTA
jgi:hypothetical protein